MPQPSARRSVLVTGAAGYLGGLCVERLAADPRGLETLVALDAREVPPERRLPGVVHLREDVRSKDLAPLLERHAVDTVVHLAFVVDAGRTSREVQYDVDVLGTRKLLEACAAARVRKLVVTSSGAAYGYHADNPRPLREEDALRGNQVFAYAWHKRLVEEMLERWREEQPQLAQLVLRLCAVLGPRAHNPVTRIFEGRFVLGVAGTSAPFSLVWDEDVVDCILRGVHGDATGVFNVAADGTLSLREMARILRKPYLPLPVPLLKAALWAGRRLGVLPWGPEQTLFLQHRPVLCNEKLKRELGVTPRRDAEQVFRHWLAAREHALAQ